MGSEEQFSKLLSKIDEQTVLMKEVKDEVALTNKRLDEYFARLDKVEKTCAEMDSKMQSSQQQTKEMVTKIQNEVLQLQSRSSTQAKEEVEKMLRKNNLIIMGLPETQQGCTLLNELFLLLFPDKPDGNINYTRVGKDSDKRRPVRVYLSNPNEKTNAIKNWKEQKGNPQFKDISITRDLTRTQLDTIKNTPPRTRLNSKRKKEENGSRGNSSSPPSKKNQIGNEPMETQSTTPTKATPSTSSA